MTYPQIYSSSVKLQINVDRIVVKPEHFERCKILLFVCFVLFFSFCFVQSVASCFSELCSQHRCCRGLAAAERGAAHSARPTTATNNLNRRTRVVSRRCCAATAKQLVSNGVISYCFAAVFSSSLFKGLSVLEGRLVLDTRSKPRSRLSHKTCFVCFGNLFVLLLTVVLLFLFAVPSLCAASSSSRALCCITLRISESSPPPPRTSSLRQVFCLFCFLLFSFCSSFAASSCEHAVAALFAEIARASAVAPLAVYLGDFNIWNEVSTTNKQNNKSWLWLMILIVVVDEANDSLWC
jgi:hypothetical protein